MLSLSSRLCNRGGLAGLRQLAAVRSVSTIKPEPWECIYTKDPIDQSVKTFDKILIANRGEIAIRVAHTCKKMGIKTVAVHSTADAASLFVKMCDEAIPIGPPPARESYLVMENILKAVEMTGAQAVHPGYGFLSENMKFVAELEKRNVTFIGPHSGAIQGMGDKLASKKLATDAKVNGIPGYDGVVENAEHCVKLSNEIGYPVMIKASAGGGGKGMRIAWNDAEAKEYFKLCSEEGLAFFNDDRMLVEKFVDKPRHVEIQVLGDKHGHAIYLNERECSIQRRNQKVIEEAPSSFIDPKTRAAMGKQAVDLAKAIGYDSAGTVEFLVDGEKNFYFLEMNTRLQVEHPITECITGVDLVQQMIKVAAGHPLKLTQKDIDINGWAFECRVYAEDPTKNFGMPSIGRLTEYKEPSTLPGVRCDSGITEGSEISVYYDPMICKLTCFGSTRDEAMNRAIKALDHYVIRGVTHNIPLLRDILVEKNFRAGNFTTGYLPQTYPDGFMGTKLSTEESTRLAAFAATAYAKEEARQFAIAKTSRTITNWDLFIQIKDEKFKVQVEKKDGEFMVSVNGANPVSVKDNYNLGQTVVEAEVGGIVDTIQMMDRKANGTFTIRFKGSPFAIPVMPALAADLQQFMIEKPKLDLSKFILTPMPGVVTSIEVEVGQVVGLGQPVCYVEAMKMKNAMLPNAGGKVKKINVKPGDKVEEEQILVELE